MPQRAYQLALQYIWLFFDVRKRSLRVVYRKTTLRRVMSLSDKTGHGATMGRPPKPAESKRNRRIVTFVKERDYTELKALAISRHMSLSALCDELLSMQISKVNDCID